MSRNEIELPQGKLQAPEQYGMFGEPVADPGTRLSMEAQTTMREKALPVQPEKNDWKPAVTEDARGCKTYSSWASEVVFGHQYTVQKGDSLRDVARRSLGVTGHPDATAREIAQEMKRIAALNQDLFPPHKGRHGMLPKGAVLRLQAEALRSVQDDNAVPSALVPQRGAKADVDCPEKERVVVKEGLIKAEKCDRFELMENTAGIVRPGADVILNRGARAFVFGGKVEARAGARVIYTGGDLSADPEARVKYVTANSITESHMPNYGYTTEAKSNQLKPLDIAKPETFAPDQDDKQGEAIKPVISPA
ncbi:MAG: hypothetical protein QG625_3090 [Cyanobacteriota bacterium erpe_2018_sw_39hr_WHONDRS-SW48-000098_B_bin.30]|nr:hypothetical protein [Cyanobacteriota bacterium erpe_2018_sw_39hr_WHONDRS-SW48-000098_B_bin.30]